jgi:hypothetical protein
MQVKAKPIRVQWGRRVGQGARILALAFAMVRPALAVPHLAPDSVTGAPGGTVAMALRLTGTAPSSAGFNATIYLPSGVTLTGLVRGSLLPSADFRLVAQPLTDPTVNAVAVLGYSETHSLVSTGWLCTLLLSIPSDTGPGDYPIVIDSPDRTPLVRGSHALSSSDGASSVAHTVGDAVLSVRISGLPGDSNGNGIPDDWEVLFFGVITNVTDLTDFDGDNLSDYREYLSGTDPTLAASCVAITPPTARDPETGAVVLRWHSVASGSYRIERSQALLSPYSFSRIGLDQAATPPMNVYTDYLGTGTLSTFYRLIQLDP